MKLENDYKKRVSTHDLVIVGKDIYFFSINYNGLYCLRMPQRQLEFLGSAPCEKFQKRHLYGAIVEVDGRLYLPPMAGEEIAIYDIQQRKFEKIALQYDYCGKGSKFLGAVYDNGKIFFIPCWYPYLVVLEITSSKVMYLDQWRTMLRTSKDHTEMFIRNGFFIKDKTLYLAPMTENLLLEISTETYETKILKVGDDSDGFVDMCWDEEEECLWFLKKSKPMFEKMDLKSLRTQTYEVTLASYEAKGEYPFICIICDPDQVCLVSYQSNCSVVMRKKEETFFLAEWDKDMAENIPMEWEAKHYFAKKIKEDAFIVGTTGNLLFHIIRKGKREETFFLEDPLMLRRLDCQKGRIVMEDKEFDLRDFLQIVDSKQIGKQEYDLEIPYGQEIYRMLKKTIIGDEK